MNPISHLRLVKTTTIPATIPALPVMPTYATGYAAVIFHAPAGDLADPDLDGHGWRLCVGGFCHASPYCYTMQIDGRRFAVFGFDDAVRQTEGYYAFEVSSLPPDSYLAEERARRTRDEWLACRS